MKDKIEKFLELFPTLTKQEIDQLEEFLKWPDEDKTAFMFAKHVFKEKE